ncbi:hypothetical protein KAR91_44785 [Candidatus Pacearchaeota archaeon]|nr:hypothetical protein [Candidatus Pacearchaeota archaeon]
MAFDTSQLALIQHVNGFNHYRYDTLDAHAAVDTDGYFDNGDDDQNIGVGDIIDVVVWATAIRTGTISTYGRHIVMIVTAGSVDTSDVTVGTVTNTD